MENGSLIFVSTCYLQNCFHLESEDEFVLCKLGAVHSDLDKTIQTL